MLLGALQNVEELTTSVLFLETSIICACFWLCWPVQNVEELTISVLFLETFLKPQVNLFWNSCEPIDDFFLFFVAFCCMQDPSLKTVWIVSVFKLLVDSVYVCLCVPAKLRPHALRSADIFLMRICLNIFVVCCCIAAAATLFLHAIGLCIFCASSYSFCVAVADSLFEFCKVWDFRMILQVWLSVCRWISYVMNRSCFAWLNFCVNLVWLASSKSFWVLDCMCVCMHSSPLWRDLLPMCTDWFRMTLNLESYFVL